MPHLCSNMLLSHWEQSLGAKMRYVPARPSNLLGGTSTDKSSHSNMQLAWLCGQCAHVMHFIMRAV